MNKIFLAFIFISISTLYAYAQKDTDIKTYHLAFLANMDVSMPVNIFDPKKIYYVGKLTINKNADEVTYQCLDENDCQSLEGIVNSYKAKDEDGYLFSLRYMLYYPVKPKRKRKTDIIEKDHYNEIWAWKLKRYATYGDEDFWLAFETQGFFDSSKYGFYKVIESNVGEKYFKEKKIGLGDLELQKAIKLNRSDFFLDLLGK